VDGRLRRKALLRRLAPGLVPREIVSKRKVGFFSHAVDRWFRAHGGDVAAEWLCRADTASKDLLEPRVVRRLVEDFRGGERANARALLAVLMLEIWLADTLPRALSPSREPRAVPA
jgi:hypothetical protein